MHKDLLTVFLQKNPNFKTTMDIDYADFGAINPRHLEGNLFSHTMMTVKEMSKISDSHIDFYASVLHDCGKPFSQTFKNSFQNINGLSFFCAMKYLIKHKISSDDIIKIMIIIGASQEVREEEESKLHLKISGFNEEIQKSIINLAWANEMGRISSKKLLHQPVDPKLFFPVGSRGMAKKNGSITFLMGLPGSGKSNWAKKQTEKHIIINSEHVISNLGVGDNYAQKWESIYSNQEKRNLFFKITKEQIIRGHLLEKDLILDVGVMSKEMRAPFLKVADEFSLKKKALVFGEDVTTSENRSDLEIVHKFNFPLYDEFHEVKVYL